MFISAACLLRNEVLGCICFLRHVVLETLRVKIVIGNSVTLRLCEARPAVSQSLACDPGPLEH